MSVHIIIMKMSLYLFCLLSSFMFIYSVGFLHIGESFFGKNKNFKSFMNNACLDSLPLKCPLFIQVCCKQFTLVNLQIQLLKDCAVANRKMKLLLLLGNRMHNYCYTSSLHPPLLGYPFHVSPTVYEWKGHNYDIEQRYCDTRY